MKKIVFSLLLIVSQVSFAAKSGREMLFLIKEVDYSFHQISLVIGKMSDAHLVRLLEAQSDNSEICREIKEKMTPFMGYLQSLNGEFKSKVVQTRAGNPPLKMSEQFSQLHKLTQSSIDKCNTTEILHVLQKLRAEIMNTAFALLRVEI